MLLRIVVRKSRITRFAIKLIFSLQIVQIINSLPQVSISSKRTRYQGIGCDNLNLIRSEDICPRLGQFGTAGDCQIFYKCYRGENGPPKPYLDHCPLGHNFIYTSCVTRENITDCPQYDCIPIDDNLLEESTSDESTEETYPSTNRIIPGIITKANISKTLTNFTMMLVHFDEHGVPITKWNRNQVSPDYDDDESSEANIAVPNYKPVNIPYASSDKKPTTNTNNNGIITSQNNHNREYETTIKTIEGYHPAVVRPLTPQSSTSRNYVGTELQRKYSRNSSSFLCVRGDSPIYFMSLFVQMFICLFLL